MLLLAQVDASILTNIAIDVMLMSWDLHPLKKINHYFKVGMVFQGRYGKREDLFRD